MSIEAARKSLQQEFAVLSRQASRVQAALQALNGETTAAQPARKYKLSPAGRRKILLSLKKARAAKAAKAANKPPR